MKTKKESQCYSEKFAVTLFKRFIPNKEIYCLILGKRQFAKMFGKNVAAGTIKLKGAILLFVNELYMNRDKIHSSSLAILLHEIGHYMNKRVTMSSPAKIQEYSAHKWAIKETFILEKVNKRYGIDVRRILIGMAYNWLSLSERKYRYAAVVLFQDKTIRKIIENDKFYSRYKK